MEIKKHKRELIDWLADLMSEMRDLSYQHFHDKIEKELEKQCQFEKLREQEKELNKKIKKVTDDHRRAQDEYS